ncbi:MAG: pyridoxamine 5'-phosphate oxidase family protein [Pseudomonadota bacterium]
MEFIEDIASLEGLYGVPGAASIRKVADHLTPLYAAWIAKSRFVVLTTVGANGTDGSPRGDDGSVVLQLDPQTLAMPDWRGNNRLDSLRNIVEDGRVSLMFLVSGSNTVVRVNGTARLTADVQMRGRFEQKGRTPATVIMIRISEVYTQCARAFVRADLWARDDAAGLPTVGEILAEASSGDEGGPEYDAAWAERAARTMW